MTWWMWLLLFLCFGSRGWWLLLIIFTIIAMSNSEEEKKDESIPLNKSMGCNWAEARLKTAIEMQKDYEEKQSYYRKFSS